MIRPFARLLPVLAVLHATAAAGEAASVSPTVTMSFQRVTLRTALQRLYEGSGYRLELPEDVPDLVISAEIRDMPRLAAARFLARVSGVAGLSISESAGAVVVSRVSGPGLAAPGGNASNTVSVDSGTSSVTGFSTAPGGTQVPNLTGTRLRSVRRVPDGVPTYLGGITGSRSSSSRSGAPLTPFGSRSQSGGSITGGTFVTVTVLPDPAEEMSPRKRERR
jgi:hypothetical protein